MKTKKLSMEESALFLLVLREEFQEIKKLEGCAYTGYQYTTFNELKSGVPFEEQTFPCEFTLERELYAYEKGVMETNGIVDKTFLFRFYSLVDQREIDDPNHFRIDHFIMSVEIYNTIIEPNKFGIKSESEFLYASFEEESDYKKKLERELKRDRSQPKFVIFNHVDPAINGDYFGESYDQVYYIGYEDQALELYERMKRARRFVGSNYSSYNYPRQIREGEHLKVDDKIILRAERPYDQEVQSEIEQYESDDESDFECNMESDEF